MSTPKSYQDMIILADLQKMYGDFKAVNSLSVNVKKGEFLTLLGPSGCGKTTTLRIIAGFEDPTSGSILIGGKHAEHLPPNKRNVNTVFQNYALFPHLSIRENIAFGLKLKHVKKQEIKERVEQVIQLVKLQDHADKTPDQLSGGQKQRVAIARAIVNQPNVLLLDEPLGALDLKLRKEMQLELKQLQKQLGMTFVYVTHDQEEALTMSDRIIIMNGGNLEQIGTAKEIYQKPQTRFVADFIGETNLFEAPIHTVERGYATMMLGGQSIKIMPEQAVKETEWVDLSLRPENVNISREPIQTPDGNCVKAIFESTVYVGNITKHIARLQSGERMVSTNFSEEAQSFVRGDTIYASWNAASAVVIKR